MSSALDLLKSANQPLKPYRGFAHLPHGNHEIIRFRLVKNKMYNDSPGKGFNLKRVLLVELKDEVIFLPEYYAVPFNDDDRKIEELNNDGVKKYLYFGGSNGNRYVLTFIRMYIIIFRLNFLLNVLHFIGAIS